MSSELSSKIIHGISHLALMSAWHMFTQEPAEHSELLQGGNQLISLLMSNLQHCEFCRWQPDETAAGPSPAGLDAPPHISPDPITFTWGAPRRIWVPQGLICSPLREMHSVRLPTWSDCPREAWKSLWSEVPHLSSWCHSSWTSQGKIAKNLNHRIFTALVTSHEQAT